MFCPHIPDAVSVMSLSMHMHVHWMSRVVGLLLCTFRVSMNVVL